MREKTIILIRNAYPNDFGGGERFPVFVSEIIQRNYGNPILITRSPMLLPYAADHGIPTIRGLWWSRQQWSGVRTLLFPAYVVWQLILFLWYLSLFLRLRPHAVHIQSKDDFISATLAARIVGARVIWTDHADIKHIWANLRVWYKNPIGKWVYVMSHLAHTITVISKSEYREVTRHLPKKSSVTQKIVIINNGSPDLKDQYPSTLAKKFTFCSTNRLVCDKGVSEMIEAYRKFQKKHQSSQLILVGNGPEEEYFKKLASDVSSIVFVGYQTDPLSFVASSHVLLQPTYHEGFSISILEAQMLQKPIIATSVGGNVEMIEHEKTGLLIPAKDSDALYSAMETLYKSPKTRDRLAKNARTQYLEKFVFDKIVKERFIPLYENTR